MSRSIIGEICPRAEAAGLRFLLAGGHAVIAHGFVRATLDWDFLVPESQRAQWKQLFGSIGFAVYAETKAFVQLQPPPDMPVVDLIVVDNSTYEKLMADSVATTTEGHALRIPSAEKMVALKLHAARQRADSHKRDSDWADVIQLVKRNNLSLDNPEFHELVLRYGGPDAIGFIKRRTREQTD